MSKNKIRITGRWDLCEYSFGSGLNIDGNCRVESDEMNQNLNNFYDKQKERISKNLLEFNSVPYDYVEKTPRAKIHTLRDPKKNITYKVYDRRCLQVSPKPNDKNIGYYYNGNCFFSNEDAKIYFDQRKDVTVALWQDFQDLDKIPGVVPKYGLNGWNNGLANEGEGRDGSDPSNLPTVVPGRQINKDRLEMKSDKAELKYIVVHHTAHGENVNLNPETLLSSHIEGRNFGDIGYNFIIDDHESENGEYRAFEGRSLKVKAAAVTLNDKSIKIDYNEDAIHIVVIGNFETEEPKPGAINKLNFLIRELMREYRINEKNVIKHGDIDGTKCPGKNFPALLGARIQ